VFADVVVVVVVVVLHFIINSVQKPLDTPLYITTSMTFMLPGFWQSFFRQGDSGQHR
jgi:hypothetical protein